MRINDGQIVFIGLLKDDFIACFYCFKFLHAIFERRFEENNFVYFERRVFIKEWLMEIAIVNILVLVQ